MAHINTFLHSHKFRKHFTVDCKKKKVTKVIIYAAYDSTQLCMAESHSLNSELLERERELALQESEDLGFNGPYRKIPGHLAAKGTVGLSDVGSCRLERLVYAEEALFILSFY